MKESIIAEKIAAQISIDDEDLAWLYQHATLEQLRSWATTAKEHHHKSNEASYIIMAIINFTNICIAKCDFCSFYRLPHQKGGYLLSLEEVCERINKLEGFGGTLVGFNNGFHPKLNIDFYADFFSQIYDKYPHLGFYSMTVAEFMFCCKLSEIDYFSGAKILRAAGTKWITGGGAEVLADSFRQRHSPGKYSVADYFKAQEAILEAGMGSTATMVVGFDETLEERMIHLRELRAFQRANGNAMPSFLCWTYKPWNNELGGKELDNNSYFKWLAISRIYLDNFKHIRTSVLTKNEEALKGLLYGANDFDIPTEDEVTEKAGATIELDFAKILSAAEKLGFKPKHREPFEYDDGAIQIKTPDSSDFISAHNQSPSQQH